ncbi:hypothetical protein PENANT_c063G09449 [Penicillium antarcticum]|uniref:Major facilitator superfamily (MFS) profile domain-containing protein n=2 Tax=Penicillium antarcticum TaxID=416450 RepID=A0A1V6PQ42_9EURO|nr:hypothetical protein PENANT_c063G09449 [Penicillium antarcticum]
MFINDEQRLFHRAYIACTGQFFQQMCGVNLITYYATSTFQEYLRMDDLKSRILAAAMGLMQPFGGLLAFFTIDRVGRRPLMTWSAQDNSAALVVAVIALFCFQFIFTVGYSGLTFLCAAELAPLQVFNFLLAEVTPIGFNTIHDKYYIVFAAINAIIEIDEIFAQSKNIFDPPRVESRMRKTLRASNFVTRPEMDFCGEKNEYMKEEVKAEV